MKFLKEKIAEDLYLLRVGDEKQDILKLCEKYLKG